jgi:hypothetical protein
MTRWIEYVGLAFIALVSYVIVAAIIERFRPSKESKEQKLDPPKVVKLGGPVDPPMPPPTDGTLPCPDENCRHLNAKRAKYCARCGWPMNQGENA